jgi:hypothetical protein
MSLIMGSQNTMGSDYGSNISEAISGFAPGKMIIVCLRTSEIDPLHVCCLWAVGFEDLDYSLLR